MRIFLDQFFHILPGFLGALRQDKSLPVVKVKDMGLRIDIEQRFKMLVDRQALAREVAAHDYDGSFPHAS
jgi:hypothetical protein